MKAQATVILISTMAMDARAETLGSPAPEYIHHGQNWKSNAYRVQEGRQAMGVDI